MGIYSDTPHPCTQAGKRFLLFGIQCPSFRNIFSIVLVAAQHLYKNDDTFLSRCTVSSSVDPDLAQMSASTVTSTERPCHRCNTQQAKLKVRQDWLCQDCFHRYVYVKIVKRMESFRARHVAADEQRHLLLAFSCRSSSAVLLHVLDTHLNSQIERTSRAPYALHVVHVDSEDGSVDAEQSRQILEDAQVRYTLHKYDRIELGPVMTANMKQALGVQNLSAAEALHHVMGSATSPTARTDLLHRLRTRRIVDYAKTHNIDAILWSDSTTRLAAKTMSETAKGRGSSLPWLVSEAENMQGIPFKYPMQDMLDGELEQYCASVTPPIKTLIHDDASSQAPVSAKLTTIDKLMTDYFATVEREYPSIVTNVVRTIGKLDLPELQGLQCALCGSDESSTVLCGSCRALMREGD